MIDSNRLDELSSHWNFNAFFNFEYGEPEDLIRLARLGLQHELLTKVYGEPERLRNERVLWWAENVARPALALVNKSWFDPRPGTGACALCEANLHENCKGKHAQLNGEPCALQVAHDALEKFPEGGDK